jgi:hypothetical protein
LDSGQIEYAFGGESITLRGCYIMTKLLSSLILSLVAFNLSYATPIELEKLNFKEGFIPLYLDESQGKLYLSVENLNEDFLYLSALATGVGSNDIGLDRGQLGQTRLVTFRKSGNKLFLVHKNIAFRASSSNDDEVQSIKDAFAESVLWGFDILQSNGESVIVEATHFFLQDTHGVADRLKDTNQGNFTLDLSRSALYMPMIKNFPKNTEIEATITVTGKSTGSYLQSVAPTPNAITVRQHHSFVQLPDSQYQPRAFDPRAGFGSVSFMDFATPIDEPIIKRYIVRHRLQKKDPSEAISEAVEPIVYYLDRGTPEPVKSALLEGGNWWNQAFEAAGFKNAFRVEIAPPDMDFLDVRYNVIQWVHRSTRGWSYGASIKDPRTGEILKGHVSLGSLRVRQDYLIAQGLLQPFQEDKSTDQRMLNMALDRLKQLSAHEIGHTIGLSHNFASSAAGRASVMDYPYPKITLNGTGKLEFNRAYENQIGAWDKWAITYGYGSPNEGVEEAIFLTETLEETYNAGYEFITDSDSRDISGAHPRSHLWDNGASAAEELVRILTLRENRIGGFGLNAIPKGQPEALLEEVFAPLYLMHRYQLEANTKIIGGMDYQYKIKGDNQPTQNWIDMAIQEKALDALLLAISPRHLEIPPRIIALIPPRPFGYSRNRETFDSRMGPIFDPITPAENIVDLAFKHLLDPNRVNRIRLQHLQDSALFGITEVLNKVSRNVFKVTKNQGITTEIARMVETKWIDQMILLAKDPRASHSVRAITRDHLQNLKSGSKATGKRGLSLRGARLSMLAIHSDYLATKIDNFLDMPLQNVTQKSTKVPDGSPIGMDIMTCNFHD